MDIEELNGFAESLDMKIQEISGYLDNCVTQTELSNKAAQIYSKLSKDVNTKIKEIYSEVSEEYKDKTPGSDCTLGGDVYTKAEIDNMGFLTEHQSLDNYITKDYMMSNYVTKFDLHTHMKCNCLSKDEFDASLKNYVSFDKLYSALDEYYTREEVENKISEILNEIPSIDEFVTKNYVSNVQNNILGYVARNFLSSENADKKYLTISEHNEFSNFVDDTYFKKSDFEKMGLVESADIQKFITKDDLADYALKSTVDEMDENLRSLSNTANKLQQKVLSLSSNLSTNYLKTSDLIKNFYTKADADRIFLTSENADKKFLSKNDADKDFLTKEEAHFTYLAIEDYKSLKSLITINDTYKNDIDTFNKLLAGNKLVDGIYIVGGGVYIVKNGKAYQGLNSTPDFVDAYSKDEIDAFDFASKEWVTENCKGHEWVITDNY